MHPEYDWAAVLAGWFADTRENLGAIPARMPWWFGPDPDRDAQLEQFYSDSCSAALNDELGAWQTSAQSRLALILLLDQFPRNLFRGTAQAFSGDHRAAMLCLSGVQAGLDQDLAPIERVFFYMPLQHAEDVITQRVSVDLYLQLAEQQSALPVFQDCASYARLHLDLIEKFGRFPHRNDILGRPSTTEEQQFLEEGGERFGQ